MVVVFGGRTGRGVGGGGGLKGEDIQVHEVPVEKVPKWLRDKEKEGAAVDPKIYSGLYFLLSEGVA